MCLEYVPPKSVLALSFTCHAIARVLRECCSCESGTHQFWIKMTTKHLGRCAFDCGLVRAEKLGPWPVFGVKLFETGLNMRREVKERIEIVLGSVAEQVGGCTVVACPCLGNLDHYGTGAQGAVRRAAGDEMEEAASKLPLPLAPLSANLVTGGKLADTIALCVTSPPREVHQIIMSGLFFRPAVGADGLSPRSRAELSLFQRTVRVEAAVVTTLTSLAVFLGMAGALAGGTDLIQNRILLTVHANFQELQEVPGGESFDPEFIAGGTPESGLLFLQGGLEGQLVDVTQDEDFAGQGVLRHGRDDIGRTGSDFTQFFEV